jgi:ribosome-associated protein
VNAVWRSGDDARKMYGVSTSRDVPIRDDSIRLGQFLKLADVIDNGADVKPLMIQGVVAVNGETETRRGRQLVKGDVVTVGETVVRVA